MRTQPYSSAVQLSRTPQPHCSAALLRSTAHRYSAVWKMETAAVKAAAWVSSGAFGGARMRITTNVTVRVSLCARIHLPSHIRKVLGWVPTAATLAGGAISSQVRPHAGSFARMLFQIDPGT